MAEQMTSRKRRGWRRTAAAIGCTLAAVVAMPADPAGATPMASYSYRLAPQTLSGPRAFVNRSCVWRVRYGNFGNVAYAQLRLYSGACADYSVRVYGQSGSVTTLYAPASGATGGTDDCGAYFEVSSLSAANRIGTGARIQSPFGDYTDVAVDGVYSNIAGGC